MSKWKLAYLPEAEDDLRKLDSGVRNTVSKMVTRVSGNPLPYTEGGYGKPLANQNGSDLTGMLKIKLKASGIRVVYTLKRTQTEMLVVVVGLREDSEVYRDAAKRKLKYGL